MRHHVIPHSLSIKIAAALDVIGTLAIEHVGYTYKLPVWHPAIIATVLGMTYALFKWKDEISHMVVRTSYHIKDFGRYHAFNIVYKAADTVTTVPVTVYQKSTASFNNLTESMAVERVRKETYKNRNRSFAPN